MEKSNNYNVARGASVLAGQQLIITVAEIIFYILLLRILTLQDIGRVSLLAALLGIFATSTQLSLPTAAARFISKSLGQDDQETAVGVARTSQRLLLEVALPALLVGSLFSPFLASRILDSSDMFLLIVCTFLAGFLLDFISLMGGCLLGRGLYNRMVCQNVLYVPLSRILGVVLASMGLGLEGVILGWVIGSLVTLVISRQLWKERFNRAGLIPGKGFPRRSLLGFSLPIYLGAVISLGQGYGDIMILQARLGSLATTGSYFLLITIMGWLQILWVPLATALAPALSAAYAKSGSKALEDKLSNALRLVNITVIPVSVAILAMEPTILRSIYSPGIGDYSPAATLLLMTTIFTAQSLLLVTGLHATGNTQPLFRIALATTGMELVIVALTASYLGPTAGALGRSILAAATLILTHRTLRRTIKLNLGAGMYQALLLSILMASPLVLIAQVMSIMNMQAPARLTILSISLVSSFLVGSRSLSIFTIQDIGWMKGALPRPFQFLTRSIQRFLISDQSYTPR